MSIAEIGDPRLQAMFGQDSRDSPIARPTMALPRRGLSKITIVIAVALTAALLFAVLNARRTGQAELANNESNAAPPTQFEAPPPLYIPPTPAPVAPLSPPEQNRREPISFGLPARPAMAAQLQTLHAQLLPQLALPMPGEAQPRTSLGSPLVIDTNTTADSDGPAPTSGASPLASSGKAVGRMRASVFANRSTTVPQGYLIPAVMETGFDSTSPGFARAVVSRDVRGFDGRDVLIPRGSRLIGDYQSEVAKGGKRVSIIWTRLMRPDGMTIALDSPAVDPVGRGGVEASVNTHFFQRLGDALLQSTFEIGRALGGRKLDDSVIVVSGTAANATASQVVPADTYMPTLRIPAGRSVSVFVAHDLDFSSAGVNK